MHKILLYNKFIICLYMFRALLCSSSRGQNCIIQHLVSSHCRWPSGAQVERGLIIFLFLSFPFSFFFLFFFLPFSLSSFPSLLFWHLVPTDCVYGVTVAQGLTHLVEFLWTRDRPVTQTSTWKTTPTGDETSMPPAGVIRHVDGCWLSMSLLVTRTW